MVSFHSHLASLVSGNGESANQRTASCSVSPTRRLAVSLTLIALLLLSIATVSADTATNSLLGSWLTAQTNIHTWSADFVQTRTLKSLTEPLTASGHISFEAPNRFRWEIEKPSPTIATRSGNEMLIIYPKLKRAERYPLSGPQAAQWRDTMALLDAGFPRNQGDLESRFRIQSQVVTNESCEISLQPKSASARRMMPLIKIAFATNDFSLRATELQFADGSTLRNDFTNGILNPKLDGALFAPKLGDDFKVVEPLKPQK